MNRKSFSLRTATAFCMVVLLMAALPVPPALAATLGPNNPGAGADDDGIGTIAWTGPGNITTPGTPYATATIPSNAVSHYLRATSYNFNIPYGSTINGIELQINRQSSGTSNPSINDQVVSLVKGGVITGENKAQTTTDWPRGFFGIATYGSASDLWGTTWTSADVNAADFGAVLAVTDGHPAQTRTATVDYMQITITYTLPNNTLTVNCGDGTPSVSYGSSISCTATVTRNSGTNTPSGSVTWTTSGSGSFGSSTCVQNIAEGTLTCTAAYTPSAVGTGTHSLTATYSGDANFSGSQGSQAVTVNKQEASVTADAKRKAYGDDNPDLTATLVGEVAGGDVISYTLATNAEKLSTVGSYPITVTLGVNPNYNVTANDGLLTVNPKAATVTADDQSKTYGDDNPALTAMLVGEVAGGEAISYTLSTTAEKLSNAANYPITVTPGTNPNYAITPIGGILTVNPKAATVTAENKSKTYGDDNPTLTATLVGEVAGGDAITYTLTTTAEKLSNVTVYPITVVLGTNPNYTVTPTGAILTVNPKPAAVTADAKSKAYGDDNPDLTAALAGEVVGGDVISYTLTTTAVKLSTVGTYPITVTLGTNPNYTVTPTNSTLTVTAKAATVTADAKSKAYGDDNPDLTATVEGEVVGGEVISYTLSTTAVKLSTVGTYPITVTLGVNPNYTVTPVGDLLTVNPKAATVTADNKSKTYGADNPLLTATVVGEVAGGEVISFTLSTSAEEFSGLGDYPITVTLGSNPNYTVTPTDGLLTVTKIPIIVAADTQSKLFGQPDPALTYQVTSGGLLSGDAFTGALSREPGEAVGPYAILQGTLALPAYYDLTYVGALFYIQTASPALSLVKTATPQTFIEAGDVIQYSYVLTNSGNVPLAGPFTVADDKATDEACPVTSSLAVGLTLTCTASYTITPADVGAGSVTNTATAAGSYASAAVVSNAAQATVRTYRIFLPIINN